MDTKHAKPFPNLRKWPQMVVTGRPVTKEQALEIIRRTDTFFVHEYSGNDRDYEAAIIKRFEYPRFDYASGKSNYDAREAWMTTWQAVRTSYVHNSWVSCSFILGPHGWCHPDGQIGFIDNIGKYPSGEDVLEDWTAIATAFPFLHIDVTLMSEEEGVDGGQPVVGFRIRGTEVTVVYEDLHTLHQEHPEPTRSGDHNVDIDAYFARRFGPDGLFLEHGLSEDVFRVWDKRYAELRLAGN